MAKVEVFNQADLGEKILLAQKIHEESWVNDGGPMGWGHYEKDIMQAAVEACGSDGFKAQLINLINSTCRNDIQMWAHHVQDLNYHWVADKKGRYTAPNGKSYEADGTEIVDDKSEKVEI